MTDFTEMDQWDTEKVRQFQEDARFHRHTMRLKAPAARAEHLVAEGDSWFDYAPAGTDIIACLQNHYDYTIDNYAKAGDTLENMIYGTRIDSRFGKVSPSIDQVLQRIGEIKPKAFLFSGGGNDVAGEELESYLNHKESGLPALRLSYVNTVIQEIFRTYFEDLIAKVASVSPETYIITHGYGHTFPTGKGVGIFGFSFIGPWLLPALARKRIFNLAEQQQVITTLIDTYNDLLEDLRNKHPKFLYIDLRGMLDPASDWANELHLKNSAFARVAERIHQEILSL
ncbi:MAG: hypothetical protein HY785_14140 [Oscillatoriophycideae cyanobacterium NC_groundwater_1537_Pr4_S-0.65um_50_18]|nr:hypothetical protein [Oscillatoriophycideae cyanobacterium NC_groundwater_1537_Pr4_S-0.65um_50_18]